MQFRTEISAPQSEYKISHLQRGVTIGSCFTTYIGEYLKNAKFPILVNPLGTVYNPVSISNSLEILTGNRNITEQDLFFHNGVWQSFLLHSSFSSVDKQSVLDACKIMQQDYATRFKKLDYIIISLGTSWVYELKQTKEIVSNCHKITPSHFERRRMSQNEIVEVLNNQIEMLRQQNSELQIIFTISPIRHWKDGAYENQVSKSTLFVAIDEILHSIKQTQYFPAYEFVIDDLRDYRFYEQDMLHPSKQAVEYIWGKFTETYFSKETLELNKKIGTIQKAIQHKPFTKESEEYKKFATQNLALCNELVQIISDIDLKEEIHFFTSKG